MILKKVSAAALLFMLTINGAAATTLTYTNENAIIYIEKNKHLEEFGMEEEGTKVKILETNGSWALVQKGKYKAYMKLSDLISITTCNKIVYTKENNTKVYNDDSLSSEQIDILEKGTKMTMVAYSDEWCWVKSGKKKGFIQRKDLSLTKILKENTPSPSPSPKPTPTSTPLPTASTVNSSIISADWFKSNISSLFARGDVVTIKDVSTGIKWQIKRTGGTNHADVQPLTANDTAKMKEACKIWSWERRAVHVYIGNKIYAGSINCMPHGGDSIPENNFNGHFCLHFTNSRTHGSNKVCSLHQAAIKKALNAK